MTDIEKIKFKAALSEMCDNLAEQAKDERFYSKEFLQYYNRLIAFVQDMKQDINNRDGQQEYHITDEQITAFQRDYLHKKD